MYKIQRMLVLLFAIILAACTPLTEKVIELDGTRWKLQNIKGQELLASTLISLEFRGGEIKGSAGCNAYGAECSIQAKNGIAFGAAERTVEACVEPEGVMQQEEQYLRTLWETTSYRVEGVGLVFIDEMGRILLQYERMPEFNVKPEDLEGRTWRLTSATGLDENRLMAFTIRFDGSEFSGTTICRAYAGNYQVVDDRLNVTFLQMTTDVHCDEVAGRTESEYTTLLENVEQYNVSQTQLELYSRRGEKLIFELVTIE